MNQGKVGVVTGARGGVGLETARGLAKAGFTTVLVGRDASKGETALASIREGVPAADLIFLRADLSDMEEVRALAAAIGARCSRLDVLVNNAGVIEQKRRVTPAGLEVMFATNHLSHFLLTGLLLDLIRASASPSSPARIINVSSEAHRWARLDFSDLQSARRYTAFSAYGGTKLANILFTLELAERLAGSGVTVNALHPGAVASGFARNNGGLAALSMALLRPLMITPEKAAELPIYLATSPEVAETTGQYFSKMAPRKPSRRALDPAARKALWDASEGLTGYPYAASLLPSSLSRPVAAFIRP